MADSWDDDEFEAPVLATPTPSAWDDEEEEDEVDAVKGPQAPRLSAEAEKRRATKIAAEREAKLDALLDENETFEDRKLRERQMVEAGDHELTDELFGGLSVGAAVVDPDSVSIKLKDLKDHLSLVQTLNDRFANSKSNHVVAFVKALLSSEAMAARFEAADLAEMLATLTAQKEGMTKSAKPTVSKKEMQKQASKNKKDKLAAQKKADDLFGEAPSGEYDQYEDQYDDFF